MNPNRARHLNRSSVFYAVLLLVLLFLAQYSFALTSGKVEGAFTINRKAFELKYAYAFRTRDWDRDKEFLKLSVLATEAPLPTEIDGDSVFLELCKQSKAGLHAVLIEFDSGDRPAKTTLFDAAFPTSLRSDGGGMREYEQALFNQNTIAGRFHMNEDDDHGRSFSYDFSFQAPITNPPAVSAGETSEFGCLTNFIISNIVALLFFVFLVSAVYHFLTGWRALARDYKMKRPFHGDTWITGGRMGPGGPMAPGAGVPFLKIGIGPGGLYLRLFILFRIFNPPVLIPWSDVTLSYVRRVLLHPQFGLGKTGVKLRLPAVRGERIAKEAARYVTASVPQDTSGLPETFVEFFGHFNKVEVRKEIGKRDPHRFYIRKSRQAI